MSILRSEDDDQDLASLKLRGVFPLRLGQCALLLMRVAASGTMSRNYYSSEARSE